MKLDIAGPQPPEELLETQRLLVRAMRSVEALAAREDLHEPVLAVAAGSKKLSPLDQVDVYREQFWLRHLASLEEDFPSVKFLMGAEPFRRVCVRYLQSCPPRDFLLRNLSADVPAFLAKDEATKDDLLLAECAKVEWAFIEAYDAANPATFDPSSLSGASEEAFMSAKLVMQAPLRLVALTHPAHELRAAVRNEVEAVRPDPRPVHLAVFRSGEDVRYIELEPAAYAVVEALQAGQPLGEACTRAIAAGADEAAVGAKLGEWFASWTQWGWLTRVEIP